MWDSIRVYTVETRQNTENEWERGTRGFMSLVVGAGAAHDFSFCLNLHRMWRRDTDWESLVSGLHGSAEQLGRLDGTSVHPSAASAAPTAAEYPAVQGEAAAGGETGHAPEEQPGGAAVFRHLASRR